MPAIVVDPVTCDKYELFLQAVELVKEFLSINSLQEPNKIEFEARTPFMKRNYGVYYYKTMNLFVNVERSSRPVIEPIRRWSYTGYKADLTSAGILAHECGHHVHNLLIRSGTEKDVFILAKYAKENEAGVSSYEPDPSELIAESMKLFILNPDLLKQGRKIRWRMLTEYIGLKPAHDLKWREVLKNAHPKLIRAAENWILK